MLKKPDRFDIGFSGFYVKKTEPEPVGLNRSRFGSGSKFSVFQNFILVNFLDKNQTEPKMLPPNFIPKKCSLPALKCWHTFYCQLLNVEIMNSIFSCYLQTLNIKWERSWSLYIIMAKPKGVRSLKIQRKDRHSLNLSKIFTNSTTHSTHNMIILEQRRGKFHLVGLW